MKKTKAAAVSRAVDSGRIAEANAILARYRAGKARLDRRVIECEQWWKLRHWDYLDDQGNERDPRPTSAWLFNCIMSKHADAIEGYPEPNIRPREPGDREEARKLSAIIPVILEQNDYEETYSAEKWQKLKQGTGITGVFWDREKLNGLGDIAIRKVDVLNIFWEPGITDIQKSRHVFTTELVDIEQLRESYPDLPENASLTAKGFMPARYFYDDSVDTSGKALVVDWYYRRRIKGRQVLHYVKYCGTHVLYATENDPNLRERGLYDHGLYPFVFDPLFPIEGSPCGYGYIDVGKSAQGTIDRMNQALEKNTLMGATPRWFISNSGAVNEAEFADFTRPFVHVAGSQLGDESLRQIRVDPMSGIYASILASKVEELKETTGNRDAANGGTAAGVTAASAIAAMQEQAGKTSRASTRASYRAYARMVNMVIELIRQFYDLPRQYRMTGEHGAEEFIVYDNSGLKPRPQGSEMGVDTGYRLPVFDIDVSVQRMSAYTKIANNEMALQMYQLGLFDPRNASNALALLDIMDFDGKAVMEDRVRRRAETADSAGSYRRIAIALAKQAGRDDIVRALEASGSADTAVSPEAPRGLMRTRGDNVTGPLSREHALVEKSRREALASAQVD